MKTRPSVLPALLSALLLTLPVILYWSLDPAVWLSRYNGVSGTLSTLLFLDVPIALCLCHWFRPHWFRGSRMLVWGASVFFFGWALVAGGMFLAVRTGHGPENGFSAACAYLFGWAYLFITLIPIVLLYLLFRGILKFLAVFRDRR